MHRWIALPLIVVCLAMSTSAFALEECEGPFKGKKPTDEQLKEVLTDHKAWIDAGHPDGDERRAYLCEANLSKTDLRSRTVNR